MNIALTNHARKRGGERKTQEMDIQHTLAHGEKIPGRGNKTIVTCRETNIRVVIVEERGNTQVIITTYRILPPPNT